MYDRIYTKIKLKNFTEYFTKDVCDKLLEYFNAVFTAREAIKKAYPFLTYEEVVEAAYDDMNVNLRRSEKDSNILYVDTLQPYKKSIRASQKNCDKIKQKSLIKGNSMNAMQYKNVPIKKVPVKDW
jgi:phosphopantetheinyl transferase (holo-ACP synthase)